jgi:hypothetical protein
MFSRTLALNSVGSWMMIIDDKLYYEDDHEGMIYDDDSRNDNMFILPG